MIDEAHERSSYTDLLLGVLKKFAIAVIFLAFSVVVTIHSLTTARSRLCAKKKKGSAKFDQI